MKRSSHLWLSSVLIIAASFPAFRLVAAELLPSPDPSLKVWWDLSAAAKIRPDTKPPERQGKVVPVRCARNEREDVQIILRPETAITGARFEVTALDGASGFKAAPENIELLYAQYLNLAQASDKSTTPGAWPDPLVPVTGPLDLAGGQNHSIWVRFYVPTQAATGLYRFNLKVSTGRASLNIPLELTVYAFALPERPTCVSAFGFSPGEVFAYHGLKTEEQRRLVLSRYLKNLSAHRISPYDPAPLDPIRVTWPDAKPPRSEWENWTGLRIVTNEVHSGTGALLINDDQPKANVTVAFEPLIKIPNGGLRLKGWFRTAIPGHRFSVTFNHFDSKGQWMSGRNNDMVFAGTGRWQPVDLTFTNFPAGAESIRVNLRATTWTETGENLGLVWVDDLSVTELATGRELLTGGDFERVPRKETVLPPEKLAPVLDFAAWDRAMQQAMDKYHFTSFRLDFPGLGGGTFHSIEGPSLLGFHESDPEYHYLMSSYGSQIDSHLGAKGWLNKAYVYWFDEPDPDQYPFVMNGFAKIKRYAPGLTRMLTEQVEPGLIGGPNLWCPISNEYRHPAAEERRKVGEQFWWYVCTGPKAPYAGLFIDHPSPEMRIWLWQTWQRKIDGVLVWQLNYWTSSAAYPEPGKPQNPFADAMSWTSGYSTPAGKKLPWGNGDGRFIYPPLAAADGHATEPVLDGPVDSIRWEHLRDGLEDYEYFCILRDRLNRARARLSAEDVARYEKLLEVPADVTTDMTHFCTDGAPIESRRQAVAEAIQKIGM